MSAVRSLGLVAAVIAGLVDVLYLWLISSQDTGPLTDGRVVLVATLVALAALAAAAGSCAPGPMARLSLLSLATSLLTVLGVVGLFSIGLPLLVAAGFSLAGALATAPAVQGRPDLILLPWAVNVPVAVGVVVLGLALT